MREGDIVKIKLLQSDGNVKMRPALLLKRLPPFGDWLLCGISSQVKKEVKNFDVLISLNHPDFKISSLKVPSIIRLGFITSVPKFKIEGSIGNISKTTYNKVISNLIEFLKK
ncbi:MAG: type II toxin-antitoxin system PemK/MazF family toxin [Bacteroidia bacterium]